MDTIAPGAPADSNDQVPLVDTFDFFALGDQSDIAAKNQRIACKMFIKNNCPIDRRYAHFIAIITHPGNDTFHDPFRMQGARRQA